MIPISNLWNGIIYGKNFYISKKGVYCVTKYGKTVSDQPTVIKIEKSLIRALSSGQKKTYTPEGNKV